MRLLICSVLLLACGAAQASVTLTHVHGLAYSADGKRLMVPSHHGLAVYENGRWAKAPGPQHDYMGFAGTAGGLYSSGHPEPGSGLVNPFGVIRSRDGGRTWDKLGLEGETDFHLLASGWSTNAIYVWNPARNSRMKAAGLHYTLDDGRTWTAAPARGLEGDPQALAVHPQDKSAVAVVTSRGVFASADHGKSFKPVAAGEGTAAHYDLDGKHLWYGSFDGQGRLSRVSLGGGPATQVKLPALVKDAVAYIAQNPADRREYAVATFRRTIFLTQDAGGTWIPIAVAGQAADRSPSLRLSLYLFKDSKWDRAQVEAAMTRAAPLLGQCGLQVRTAMQVLDVAPRFRMFSTPVARELLKAAKLRKPAVFFVDGTLNDPPYDAEAIGRGNSASRPELADTVWVAHGARDLPQVLAHELVHVLSDSGAHSAEPGNLMAEETSAANTRLTPAQCERLRSRAQANGLLAR